MTPEYVIGVMQEAIRISLIVSAPLLLTSLAIGLLIAIFQTATQINEMTLTFVPKMLAIFVVLVVFFPWMLRVMVEFLTMIITNMPEYTV